MVLKDRNDLIEVWGWIKAAAAENVDTPTVLLLFAQSIDSLAACAILTRLLEDEMLSHKVVPVADYGDLSRVYTEQVVDSSELRSIVLINCGGIINLMEHLQTSLDEDGGAGGRKATELPHPETRWYVLDSHRPYALENLTPEPGTEDRVFILHDGEEIAEMDDLLAQVEILYDGSDGDESDDEDYEPVTQRRRTTLDEYDSLSPDSKHDRRVQLRKLLRRYYATSWHGTASAVLMYSLVQNLNKGGNELLWLAIVGLTDQLTHERIEFERYVEEAQLLQAEVGALNQDGVDETSEIVDDESGTTVSVRQHVASRMRLDSVQELRLSLMRHWTVYEALTHSPYISSRLGLYQENGREKLDVWLARMGLPLDECKQEYAYMTKRFKDPLYEKMLQYGGEFGLVNLTYPSFRAITSYGISHLSAADHVTSVAAVLENCKVAERGPEAAHASAFAAARSALTSAGVKDSVMKDGMEQAKALLRATVTLGHSILMQKEYQNLADFYTVELKAGGDSVRFLQPLALTKLALFVADALREGIARLRGEPKPLLMATPNPEADPPDFLVVAVLGSSRCWRAGGKNGFGNAFARAAAKTGAHIAHDGFDSAVCRVSAADLERFKEQVALELNPSW